MSTDVALLRLKKPGKWSYTLLGGLLLYSLAGFFLAPWLLQRTLVNTLDDRLDLQTQVNEIRINPFSLSLRVDGLALSKADGSALLGFERLFVNFQVMSLFRWAWSFNELHLINPSINFERFTESDNTFSRLATGWAASAPSTTAAAAEDAQDSREAELLRLVIADLRIVRGRLQLTDHVPAETFTTEVSPIDLDIAGLSTLPGVSGAQQVTITTESGARLAWTGNLSVNPISLNGQVSIVGTHTPLISRYFREYLPVTLDGGDVEGQFRYAIALEAGELSVHLEDFQGTLEDLSIKQPDGVSLAELASIRFSGGRLSWPEQELHLDELSFDRVSIEAVRNLTGSYLNSTPSAAVEPPPAVEPLPAETEPATPGPARSDEPGWQLSLDSLKLNDWRIRHTDRSLADAVAEVADLDLVLGNISNQAAAPMSLHANATMASGGLLSINGSLTALPAFTLTSQLQVTELSLAVLQPYLSRVANIEIEDGSAGLTGNLVSRSDLPFQYSGDFRIDRLQLLDEAQRESLMSWSELTIDQMALTPDAVEISELKLLEPYFRIEIERNGSTNIERTLVAAGSDVVDEESLDESAIADNSQPSIDTAETATAETGPFPLTIGKITISDASARYTDLALPLPFEANISALLGSVSTLSSTSADSARVEFEGQVNEYGRVTIDGTLQPFAMDATTDIRVNFENVNMSRMTPYTIKFAGREIADGRTDLDLSYRLVEGYLEGDNRLVIRDLKLGEKVDHTGAMSLPLDLAVALLSDPSGKIDFNFPVSGALDDPEFSYAGAIGKAFSNIILNLVTSPFRLLGSLVGIKPESLESVSFEPGRSDLTPPQRETLGQLAEALAQRPQLRLEIPLVLNPAVDSRALQVATVDAAIDARIAADTEADTAEDTALLTERRQRAVEALFDSTGGTPDRLGLQQMHSSADTTGTVVLDTLAYTEAMREALIDLTPFSQSELQALASSRMAAVVAELSAAGSVPADRLRQMPLAEVSGDAEGQVVMPLTLTTQED